MLKIKKNDKFGLSHRRYMHCKKKFRNVLGNFWAANEQNYYQKCSWNFSGALQLSSDFRNPETSLKKARNIPEKLGKNIKSAASRGDRTKEPWGRNPTQ